MRHRQTFVMLLLFILLFTAVLAIAVPGSVLGQMTIPTRTPTPKPIDPTDPPPEPTDDNGGGNPPSPTDPPPVQTSLTPSNGSTNTPIPPGSTQVPTGTIQIPVSPTRTAGVGTVPATTTSKPIDLVIAPGTTPVSFPVVAKAFPTAKPCGIPPTFTTLITAKVRSGPGNDYDLIEILAKDQTRPIVGRAVYSSWWLIQMDGKFNQGWINDDTGIAHGNTNNVPQIPAPNINGSTPTPGVKWDATPIHVCELTATVTPISLADQVVSGTINEEGGGSSSESENAIKLESESDERNIIAATAAPLEIPSAAPTPNLLPIAGLVLIIAAVFVALFLRRSPGGGEPTS